MPSPPLNPKKMATDEKSWARLYLAPIYVKHPMLLLLYNDDKLEYIWAATIIHVYLK